MMKKFLNLLNFQIFKFLNFQIIFLSVAIINISLAQTASKSIENALNYLSQTQKNDSYNLQLMQEWLSLKYHFDKDFKTKKDSSFLSKPLYEDDAPAYNFYNALLGKPNLQSEDSLKKYFNNARDLERILVWGANAAVLPFDTICQQIVHLYSLPNANIRQVSHVALAFYWADGKMDEAAQNCFKNYQKKLEIALLNGIAQKKFVTDSWMEGLTGLICLQKQNLIKKSWLKALKKSQNPDGGWAWDKTKSQISHPHPSTLALWILVVSHKSLKSNDLLLTTSDLPLKKDLRLKEDLGLNVFLKKCVSCHRPNGNAPIDFTSYNKIARFKSMIEYVVNEGIMPPWRPDNKYNQYKHNRGLEPDEKEKLLAWIKNLKKSEVQLPWEGLYLKNEVKTKENFADLSHPTGLEITVYPKDTTIVFEFPFQLNSAKNISQIEFYCSNMNVIHHVNYFAIDSAKAAGKQATVMNENFLSNNDIALGYAPGNKQLPFEKGYGFVLPKNGKIVGDIHLSPTSKSETLQFGFKFHYSNQPIEHVLFLQAPPNLTKVNYTKLELQPNEIRTFKAYYTLSESVKILYTHPHLHVFGKSFLSYAITPQNDTIPIIKIDKWKFYEQEYYELKEPIILKKGTKIFYEATYDNTAENPMNPFSPPVFISEGWSTNQEMMLNLLICTRVF